MNKEQHDYCIVVRDNVLSEDLCKFIIDKFEKCEEKNLTSDKIHKKVVGENIFKTTGIIIDDYTTDWIDIFNILYSSFRENIQIYSEKTNFSLKKYNPLFFPYCNIQRIEPGGCYKPHIDNFISDNRRKTDRVVTLIWYLNDVSEGGETHFINTELKIKPKVGRLAMFPSNHPFVHEGLPPKSTKYIISCWLEVKKIKYF